MKKKHIALLMACTLAVGATVGGTVAWLTAQTTQVQNVFTTSDINVTLTESENLNLEMVPGWTITKDPKASVVSGSEDSWLFVKVIESDNFGDFMTYSIAAGWEPVEGQTNIYAREVAGANIGTAYPILANDQVTVLGTVTKEQMNAINDENRPTLTFDAAAVQLYKSNNEKFTAKDALATVTWTD